MPFSGFYFCRMSGIGPGTGVAEAGAMVCCADAADMPVAARIAPTHTLRMKTLVMTFSSCPKRDYRVLSELPCCDCPLRVFDRAGRRYQVGTMPTRLVNGLATASLPSKILSGSAGKAREAGPSITAAPSRGL